MQTHVCANLGPHIFYPNLSGHVLLIQIEMWTNIQVSTKILILSKISNLVGGIDVAKILSYYVLCIPAIV